MTEVLLQTRFRDILRRAAVHLGLSGEHADQVVGTGCLRLEGVPFAIDLDETTRQVRVLADCGLPAPWQEADLHRQLLQQALDEDMPGLAFGLHPVSGHVVALGRVYLPSVDDEGWLLAGLVAAALGRIVELKEKFSLTPQGIRSSREQLPHRPI